MPTTCDSAHPPHTPVFQTGSFVMPHFIIRLLPFFLLASVYVVWCNAGRTLGYNRGLQAFFKTCPIWYLVFFVIDMLQQTPPQIGNNFDDFRLWIAMGLLISSLGDVCLVWKDMLFIPGILFFGLAHTCYIVSFNLRGTNPHGNILLAEISIPIVIFCLTYILSGIDTWAMTILVALYTFVLLWMGYLSIRRYEHIQTPANLCGMVGGSCFLLSDFMLGVEKWQCCLPVPNGLCIMMYYTAQLGLACSATEEIFYK